MNTLIVSAPSKIYEITIGQRTVRILSRVLNTLDARLVHIVTDSNVAPLYLEDVREIVKETSAECFETILGAGEEYKTPETVGLLYSDFVKNGLTRSGVIIALGGGVVGDTAGFAAATYMRGVEFIQIPTTLIAMTDSSVGGKTGVNLPEGKNLAGAFHQPFSVIIDTDFLKTLPEREMLAGMAEVVKYYALGSEEIFSLLSSGVSEEILFQCCRAKASYVAGDERDTGERRALNFGHTFGHAVEKYYNYGRYNHGEAVAIGMRLALLTGEKLGITPTAVRKKVLHAAELAGLVVETDCPPPELVPLMLSDKKNEYRDITLVLLRDIGEPVIYKIEPKRLKSILEEI